MKNQNKNRKKESKIKGQQSEEAEEAKAQRDKVRANKASKTVKDVDAKVKTPLVEGRLQGCHWPEVEAGSSGAVISGKAKGSGYKAKKAEKVKKAAATNESTPTPQYGPKQVTHLRLGSAEGREPSGLILSDDGRQLRVPVCPVPA